MPNYSWLLLLVASWWILMLPLCIIVFCRAIIITDFCHVIASYLIRGAWSSLCLDQNLWAGLKRPGKKMVRLCSRHLKNRLKMFSACSFKHCFTPPSFSSVIFVKIKKPIFKGDVWILPGAEAALGLVFILALPVLPQCPLGPVQNPLGPNHKCFIHTYMG